MKLRCQLFFADQNVGWSETYWNNKASSIIDLRDNYAPKLANTRIGLLGVGASGQFSYPGPVLTYIRCEDTDTNNIALVDVAGKISQTSKDRSSGQADVPWSTVLVRYQMTDAAFKVHRSMRELSGCPDDVIVDPPGPAVSGDWYKNFLTWVAFLKNANNGWCLPYFTYTVIANTGLQNVLWQNGQLQLTFTAAPFTTSPQNVILRGFTPRQWNGPVTIGASIAPPGVLWTTQNKIFKAPQGPQVVGTLNTRVTVLAPITDVILRGETHRARGRVFGQPRGRRPARAK